jgi:hypothetical protein
LKKKIEKNNMKRKKKGGNEILEYFQESLQEKRERERNKTLL